MPSTRNSLVLGVVSHLPAHMTYAFSRSLRATNYAGRVCLFVSKMKAEDINILRAEVDEVIEVDPEFAAIEPGFPGPLLKLISRIRSTPKVRRLYPAIFRALSGSALREAVRRRRQRWLEYWFEGLQSLRYEFYAKYLEERQPDFVLVTDVRDVFFQRDPFEHEVDELELFLETDQMTIGGDPFNRSWVSNLYGRRTMKKLARAQVSCSGTTIGSFLGIQRYLRAMVSEVASQVRPLRNHDQGIHNVLLHTGRLKPVTVYSNDNGPVITLGREPNVRQDDKGNVINRNGRIPAVVHQFDRHGALTAQIEERFGQEGFRKCAAI